MRPFTISSTLPAGRERAGRAIDRVSGIF
jgi:hypothetical protein